MQIRKDLVGQDWSSTDLARCPDCDNSNPKMSLRYLDGIAGDE